MSDSGKRTASYHAISQTHLMPGEEMLEVVRQQKTMSFGVPRELDKSEYRVPLTPQGVELLVANGHRVVIESRAGSAANYHDHDFAEAGAEVVSDHREPFKCDVLLKITPPNDEEIKWLSPNQLLISLLYLLKQNRDTLRNLMDRRVYALAYEFLKDETGCYPVVQSMSEIEGYASVMIASEYLSKAKNGKGVLLGGITGITPAEVVIIGAGTAGEFAARAALGLGCQVKVFDNSYSNLRELERNIGRRVFTSILHPHVLGKALKSAEAVIVSLRYHDPLSSFFITDEQVATMKKGSIIVDLSMCNGGCFQPSSGSGPVTIEQGVIHYRVHNMASRVARTASIALSNIFAPLLLNLAARGGIVKLINQNIGISHGTYIYKGILTNHMLGQRFDLPSKDIGLLMAAF